MLETNLSSSLFSIPSGFSDLDCNPFDIPVLEDVDPLSSWDPVLNRSIPIKGDD